MVLGRFNIAVVVTSRAGAGRISSAFTSPGRECGASVARTSHAGRTRAVPWGLVGGMHAQPDRKSTRLNSSHSQISYAVFCLKKKICQANPTVDIPRATGLGALGGDGPATPLKFDGAYQDGSTAHGHCDVRAHHYNHVTGRVT